MPASDPSRPWRGELRALWQLAAPIVFVQLGMRAMNTVDLLMIGHYGKDEMAAVAVGSACLWLVTMFGLGFLMAIDPLLSQAVGARDRGAVTRNLLRGIIWSLLLTPPMLVALGHADGLLALFTQDPALVRTAAGYTEIVSWSTWPVLLFGVVRQFFQSHHTLRPMVITIVLANALNLVLDWALIYGHLGVDPMGIQGAAWATCVSRWFLGVSLLVTGAPLLAPHLAGLFDRQTLRAVLRPGPLLRIGRLGTPIGIQLTLELGIFALTTLLMMRFGERAEVAVAGHQIALDLASITFMVPMGLGIAASVRVGNAVGRGDPPGWRRSASAALVLSAAVMACFMALFLLLPGTLASLYLAPDETAVLAMAATLVPIAGVFQVVDGVQVVTVGILRGLGDTRTPLLVNLVGFWGIGLPVGYALAFGAGYGPAGLWWGLVAGLTAVALLLLLWVRRKLHLVHERLAME